MKTHLRWSIAAVLLLLGGTAADVRGQPDDDDAPRVSKQAATPAVDVRPAQPRAAKQPRGDSDDQDDRGKNDKDDEERGAKNQNEKGPGGQSDDDDDEKTPLSLTAAQRDAVGIHVERAVPLATAPPIDGYATVLDPAALVNDLGRMESGQASAAAASAEAERTQRLYKDDAQASLKSWQAAQAQAAEAAAQARAAAISFALQWGPIVHLTPEARHALIERLTAGQTLLLRADVPGRHIGTQVDPQALLEVDGVHVAAAVLGPLPRTDVAAQSAGWLLQITHAPEGLGPGARALAHLRPRADVKGLLIPASALVYSDKGAFVYREEAGGGQAFHFAAIPVHPVTRVGNAWLVEGIGRTDPVVTQGAGVLWSLQGIGSFSAAEEDHD
jgi:hypothetical protein